MPVSAVRRLTPALMLLLAGCAVTHVDPPAPVTPPAQFKETGLWQRAAAVNSNSSDADAPVPDDWWRLFGDAVLDDLQSQLLIGNENLKFAVAQVASARAALASTNAQRWPSVSAQFVATRSSQLSTRATTPTGPTNNLSLTANANWELDLWGRLAEATRGAESQYRASQDDLAAARLSAQALLAQTYFAMRTAEAQQALLERTVGAFQRTLELTQARYAAGVVGQTDVLQAQSQLKSAQAQAFDAEADRAGFEHAIAVLLGKPPAEVSIDRTATLPNSPAVPKLLPATLLERRPDIAAAEKRVAASYAQIGVADAAFFPSLVLSASAGTGSSVLGDLFKAPNLVWSIGPALAMTLFDGGARQAASDQARAQADQAASSYRLTVLTSLQEVEDNLSLADRLRAEVQAQQESLQFSRRNLDLTTEQYRAGTVSYLNVVIAQTLVLNSELSLLGVRNRELVATNQLLKNIAGRWE